MTRTRDIARWPIALLAADEPSRDPIDVEIERLTFQREELLVAERDGQDVTVRWLCHTGEVEQVRRRLDGRPPHPRDGILRREWRRRAAAEAAREEK